MAHLSLLVVLDGEKYRKRKFTYISLEAKLNVESAPMDSEVAIALTTSPISKMVMISPGNFDCNIGIGCKQAGSCGRRFSAQKSTKVLPNTKRSILSAVYSILEQVVFDMQRNNVISETMAA